MNKRWYTNEINWKYKNNKIKKEERLVYNTL